MIAYYKYVTYLNSNTVFFKHVFCFHSFLDKRAIQFKPLVLPLSFKKSLTIFNLLCYRSEKLALAIIFTNRWPHRWRFGAAAGWAGQLASCRGLEEITVINQAAFKTKETSFFMWVIS